MTDTPFRRDHRPLLPVSTVERVVDLARLAPSIHNTQPWRWVDRGRALELWADRERALPRTDPDLRNLYLSCGAALHHALVAARGVALEPAVDRFPDARHPELVATLHLRPAPTHRDTDLVEAIRRRCTDRRRFTAWPVPAERVRRLAALATPWGAEMVPVLDTSVRRRVELMVEQARAVLTQEAHVFEEMELWIDHGPDDGIPRAAIPEQVARPGYYPSRFSQTPAPLTPSPAWVPEDGLAIIATTADDRSSAVRAGEALSAIWLRATTEGLSLVPLSQVLEYEPTRELLRSELSLRYPVPQIVVRIGWQEIGRGDLVRTPRRPLNEVLQEARP